MSSPYMGLSIPDPAGYANTWGYQLISDLSTIDQHDHSPGKGAPISSSALNINSDLSFNSHSVSGVLQLSFNNFSGPNSTTGSLYAVNGDLWFNDGYGRTIQLTSNGAVAGSSGGGGDISCNNLFAQGMVETASGIRIGQLTGYAPPGVVLTFVGELGAVATDANKGFAPSNGASGALYAFSSSGNTLAIGRHTPRPLVVSASPSRNGLLIVRGQVDQNGNIINGEGFGVQKQGTGQYYINYAGEGFYDNPVVVVSCNNSQSFGTKVTSAIDHFVLNTTLIGVAADTPFTFIVAGQRADEV